MVILSVALSGCQTKSRTAVKQQQSPTLPVGTSVWVAFYNVENLFDTDDDPGKDDSEFLPSGELGWKPEVYVQKLDNLTEAVNAMNNGRGPDILGLAEVENAQTLRDWTTMTGLKQRGYEFILEEGPDPRGIDCAFMFDPAIFVYKSHTTEEVEFPAESDYVSRLVLRVDGEISGAPISVIVVHWPSRYGGQVESEPRRLAAARATRKLIEDRWEHTPESDVIVMGDFNDDPSNRSLSEVLAASLEPVSLGNFGFYNPLGNLHEPDSVGTLTYRGKWNLFDQVLVSAHLLDEEGTLEYVDGSAGIHNPEFMQVGGDGYAKDMPRRAIYRGEFQERGFSDHFPVYIRLKVR